MSTTVISLIIVAAIAVLLVLAIVAWALRGKRTERHRIEAGAIRDRAAEQSHEVGQREALADETAARSRAAQAEAEAMAARAASLQHQAQQRHSDAVTARGEVNREYERADKVDPGVETGDPSREDTETRDAPRQDTTAASKPHHG